MHGLASRGRLGASHAQSACSSHKAKKRVELAGEFWINLSQMVYGFKHLSWTPA